MSYELKGKLIEIFNTVEVSDRFKKREFVVEKVEEGNSTQFVEQIKFQSTQDRCDMLNSFQVGEEVKVMFNIKGRKWEKEGNVNYFTNLEAWKIDKLSADNNNYEANMAPAVDNMVIENNADDNDVLPF